MYPGGGSWPGATTAIRVPSWWHPDPAAAQGAELLTLRQHHRIQAALQSAAAPGESSGAALPAAQVQPSLPWAADEPMPEERAGPRGQQRSTREREQIRAASQQGAQQQGCPWIRLAVGLGLQQLPGPVQAPQKGLRLAITPQPPVQRPPATDPKTGQQSGGRHREQETRPLSVPPCEPSPVRGSDPPVLPCPCRSSAVPPGSTG